MEQKEHAIWIANHPFGDRAFFFRQKIHRILLTSQVKALLNLVGSSLWIAETEGSDSAPKQWDRLPDRYTEAVLYHVRTGRVVQREEILGFQGIHPGDVCVLFRGDSELLGIQAELIRGTPEFPVYIPDDLPEPMALVTALELLEMRRRQESTGEGEKENSGADIVFMGDIGEKEAEKIKGPRGTFGESGAAFVKIWNSLQGTVALEQLAVELARLREVMKGGKGGYGRESAPDRMACAEIAARAGEGVKTVEFLQKAGNRAREAAERMQAVTTLAVLRALVVTKPTTSGCGPG